MRKPTVGAVILHKTGVNPYFFIRDVLYGKAEDVADRREALAKFKATGELPEGFSAWDDKNRVVITSPDQVDWQD